ncbi:CyP450 monooxygenase [Pilatotrama ljubarskyi]|nr:CyP450 monooxygenase [Pilatotrama ljubarskyi]
MRATYGDMVYLRVPGQPLLVIGGAHLATEYLEKHSTNSSDRPTSPAIKMSGQDFNFGFMPYGPWWRRHRRAFWQYFHPATAVHYQSIQRASTHGFLIKLLESPGRLKNHIRWSLTATMLKVLFDIDAASEDDAYIRIVETALLINARIMPGGSAVEMFPFLRYLPSWFPGAGFQNAFKQSRLANQHIKNAPFDKARESIIRGETRTCVVAEMLARLEMEPTQDPDEAVEIYKNVCGVAFEAGTDTVSVILVYLVVRQCSTTTRPQTFAAAYAAFVALALNPEVRKKAQAEIDAVVGPARLPDYSDSDALVYANALVKEVLRWHVVVPLSIAHRTIRDDEFNGYFIPAGTSVIPNVWEMLHDPEAYDHPDEFRPERFIRDGRLDPTVRDPTSFMFGFGRRICPGRHFANASLFILIASVLQVFDVELQTDENGQPLRAEYQQTHGLVSYPEDCPLTIKPRSAEAIALTRKAQGGLAAK